MAAVNERVYGAQAVWQDAYPHYESTIEDKDRFKIANYNTLADPITEFYTQTYINQSHDYTIFNNWDPRTGKFIDNSLVASGLGPQSGLSNVQWWGYTKPEPGETQSFEPILYNTDARDITNICFGTQLYRAPIFCPDGSVSSLNHDNVVVAYWQRFEYQMWAKMQTTAFSISDSGSYPFPRSGLGYTQLITQIPIHNCILSPHITLIKDDGTEHTYNSIEAAWADRGVYKNLKALSIEINFKHSSNAWSNLSVQPLIFDPSNIALGMTKSWSQDEQDYTEDFEQVILPQIYSDEWHFLVAGRLSDNTYPGSHGIPQTDYYSGHILGCVLQTPEFNFIATSSNQIWCPLTGMTKNTFVEGIRKQLASFGLFFVDDVSDRGAALDADTMHLGLLDDGIGYGRYSTGQDNRSAPQWDMDDLHEVDYTPRSETPFRPDPNQYRDGMSLAQVDNFETATMRYNLYQAQAHQVFASMWSIWSNFDDTDPDLNGWQVELKTKKMFLTNNPLDCLIGLKYFPIDGSHIGSGEDTPVKLGALTLYQDGAEQGGESGQIQCKIANASYIHDCGSIYCAPQYQGYSELANTFIDQYVGFELYLPFCGSVKLDTATYIGKWVNIKYHIDLITGACTAYIGIPNSENKSVSEFMEIRSGNCAVDVPISGIQQATLESQMFNATQQLKGAALKGVSSVVGNLVSTIGKAAAQDVGGAVAGGISSAFAVAGAVNEIQQAKYTLNHTQLPVRMIGSASSLSGVEGYLKPMLIVTEPLLDGLPADYGHTVGYACLRYGKLSEQSSGYTEIESIDLSGIACTEEEKVMIRSICAGGIYV